MGRSRANNSLTVEPQAADSKQVCDGVLAAARAGDDEAFSALVAPHRRGLHLHCYRMLGTIEDADDALQDTLVRAWRAMSRFQPRAPLRAWLYRIATNVCLTMLASRAAETRRRLTRREMYDHIGPYPDAVLEAFPTSDPLPDRALESDENIQLAFVAAVQLLPARQRAVLLLRDVLEFSTAEVADLLETSAAAVNSALQRARATVAREREVAHVTAPHSQAAAQVERKLVGDFCRAWRAGDIAGLVRLLVDDAVLTMPPQSLRIVGRGEVPGFLVSTPAGGNVARLRFIETRVNRQPAIAVLLQDANDGQSHPYALMVFSTQRGSIASICRFGLGSLSRLGIARASSNAV